jgi:hypothetical protein
MDLLRDGVLLLGAEPLRPLLIRVAVCDDRLHLLAVRAVEAPKEAQCLQKVASVAGSGHYVCTFTQRVVISCHCCGIVLP